MNQQEIETILNSSLSNKLKSELISNLFYVLRFQEGGKTKSKRITATEEISVGDKEFSIAVASTPEERTLGLKGITHLDEDEGMLFIFEEELTDSYFDMSETDLNLDIVFFDNSGEVVQVSSIQARDPEPVVCETPYQYVLEVNINSGIQIGDELDQEDDEFSDEDKEQIGRSKMLVLNSDGDVLMKLSGGERIVSRIKTRQLIKAALKAYKSDEDKDYRRVGRIIIKELDAQDEREPQYVEK